MLLLLAVIVGIEPTSTAIAVAHPEPNNQCKRIKLTTEMCALHFNAEARIIGIEPIFLYVRSNRRLQCRFGMNQIKSCNGITIMRSNRCIQC